MLKLAWKSSPLLLIMGVYAALQYSPAQQLAVQIPKILPYVLGLLLVFVALSFNRSKTAIAATNICMLYAVIQNGLQQPYSENAALFLLTSTAYALNLVLAIVYREKGCFSFLGLSRISWVVIPYALIWFAHQQFDLAKLSQTQSWLFESLQDERLWVTQGLLTIQLGGGLWILIIGLIKRNVADTALVLAWVAGCVLFYDFNVNNISVAISCTLLLALFFSFLQSVWALAFLDALTQLPSRRALNEKLSHIGPTYALAMLDVDHFKKFNDTFGHDVGDQVLKLVASKLSAVQMGGHAYRYGGEEFTIVFPGKQATDIKPALEKVRLAIADYEMKLREENRQKSDKKGAKRRGIGKPKINTVHITISIGVSDARISDTTPEACIKRADEALYQAKQQGRNQVVIASDP